MYIDEKNNDKNTHYLVCKVFFMFKFMFLYFLLLLFSCFIIMGGGTG